MKNCYARSERKDTSPERFWSLDKSISFLSVTVVEYIGCSPIKDRDLSVIGSKTKITDDEDSAKQLKVL